MSDFFKYPENTEDLWGQTKGHESDAYDKTFTESNGKCLVSVSSTSSYLYDIAKLFNLKIPSGKSKDVVEVLPGLSMTFEWMMYGAHSTDWVDITGVLTEPQVVAFINKLFDHKPYVNGRDITLIIRKEKSNESKIQTHS